MDLTKQEQITLGHIGQVRRCALAINMKSGSVLPDTEAALAGLVRKNLVTRNERGEYYLPVGRRSGDRPKRVEE